MNKKIIIIIGFLAVLIIIIFLIKPCGRTTSSASLIMDCKCYGSKTQLFSGAGGGTIYCLGICGSSKKPDFTCNIPEDCISACG
jgi:hypothetical protein